MATRVVMPEMGEGVIEGTIARWLKNEGYRVEKYEPILEIETDKVTTEATAEVAGSFVCHVTTAPIALGLTATPLIAGGVTSTTGGAPIDLK